MRIGTTPTHNFTIPFDLDLINEVEITYKQNGKIILQKYKEDCVLKDNTISVNLEQEETFDFSHEFIVEIQIRVTVGEDNKTLASEIYHISCEECLSSEVL